jgi:hypothetical protein
MGTRVKRKRIAIINLTHSAFFAHLGPKPTLILPLASCSVSTSVNGYSVEKLPHYSHYGAHPISVHI